MSVSQSCKTGPKLATCCVGGLLEGANKLVIERNVEVDGNGKYGCTYIKNYLFSNFSLPFLRPPNKENKKLFSRVFSLLKHEDSEFMP